MVRLNGDADSLLRASLVVIAVCLWLGGCGGDVSQPPPPANFKIQMASVDNAGTPGDSSSYTHAASMSATGRYVAFESSANNLSDVAKGATHAFVRDTCIGASNCTRTTTLASIMNDGTVASSGPVAISPDGRFVAFVSFVPASNMVSIFLRDTCIGASNCRPSTQVVSVASDGTPANASFSSPAISQGGRYVAFQSNGQIVVRDTCFGAPAGCMPSTHLVSVAPDGTPGNGPSGLTRVSITPDGRFIAFESTANNLVPNVPGQQIEIFVRDTCAGASFCNPSTTLVSIGNDGTPGDLISFRPSISSTGRFVSFLSDARNLLPTPHSGQGVFVRDTCLGASNCRPSTALAADGGEVPAISGDGRFVIYTDFDQAFRWQIFARDTCSGVRGCTPSTKLASVAADGTPNNGYLINGAFDFIPIAISSNGNAVAFTSSATNLVPGTQNNTDWQVYVAPNPFR